MKSLVVDDDFTCSYIFQTQLSKFGQCETVSNGLKAVKEYETSINNGHPYELMIIDIMMPDINGFDVLKQIRLLEESRQISFPFCVKIIIATGLDDNENREIEKLLNPQSEAYLVKSNNTNALIEKLNSLGFDIN